MSPPSNYQVQCGSALGGSSSDEGFSFQWVTDLTSFNVVLGGELESCLLHKEDMKEVITQLKVEKRIFVKFSVELIITIVASWLLI